MNSREQVHGEMLRAVHRVLDDLIILTGECTDTLDEDLVGKATEALTTLSRNLVLPDELVPENSEDLRMLRVMLQDSYLTEVVAELFLEHLTKWLL